MPSVKLSGPEEFALPDARVLFADGSRMPLALPTRHTTPAHELLPGTYSIMVQNPNGHGTTLASAVTIVPPPTVTSVQIPPAGTSPGGPYLCNDQPQTMLVGGTAFRTDAGVSFVGGVSVPAAQTTLQSATQISVTLPAGSFARAGVYTVRVANTDGCVAPWTDDAKGIGITDVKVLPQCLSLGQISVNPTSGSQASNQMVTLSLTGNVSGSQVAFSPGGGQEATIVAPLKTKPGQMVAIALSQVTFVNTTTLTAVIPTCSGTAPVAPGDPGPPRCPNGIAAGGGYAIYVSDPNGGVGSVPAAQGYTVTP
jgi:hypothetical protein